MKTALVAIAALFSFTALADAPKVLTDDEAAVVCAQALPKQLACKDEFCGAMVAMRLAKDPRFKARANDPKAKTELQAACLKEIAVDGTGTEAERMTRCKAWSKSRPAPKMTRAQADELAACWTKPVCGEQISCWGEKVSAAMSSGT